MLACLLTDFERKRVQSIKIDFFMASPSRSEFTKEDVVQEEELERFDDFTLASSWERFISEIEATVQLWMGDDTNHLLEKGAVHLGFSGKMYKINFELRYAGKTYRLEYCFETSNNGPAADWTCILHDLQLSFGVKDFLVIAPQSSSGVVLDGPEASKLLSAVAIALSNCSCLWPAFVPVHDPSRKAYIGIQNMGTVFTRRFETDRIGSQVPVKLMHLEGLYELFVSKFGFSKMDISMYPVKVHFTMKLTYSKPSYDNDDLDDDGGGGDGVQGADAEMGQSNGNEYNRTAQWDDDCPWSEWYSAEDPVRGFQLVAVWLEKIVDSSLEMAEMENASPHEAEKWILIPNLSPYSDELKGNMVGFALQLRLLVDALNASFGAKFLEDFVSVENSSSENLKPSMVIPPPSVLDRVLKDLFHEVKLTDSPCGDHKNSLMIKGSPLDSLFAQFCLHSIWFGGCNIRAIAVFWIEFVREVRWCWEESQPLPRMVENGVIDLSTCLINQKLQMLAICIKKKICSSNVQVDAVAGEDLAHFQAPSQDSHGTHDSLSTSDVSCHFETPSLELSPEVDDDLMSGDAKASNNLRMGSAGVVGSMMLLKSHQRMHAPFTQDAPLMTEDMHEERLQTVEALGDTANFSAQLERDILCSDMSSFKAANPDAVFEDFIRWHSPGDWEDDDVEDSKGHWPPRGRLSRRMSEHGNLWRKIWNDAAALPASEQKFLMDPNREGEKALHYLETLLPHHLLEQIICTAFRAAADTLNQTNFGGLKQMTTKLDQLYLTIASVLKSLHASSLSAGCELIEDLNRLCAIFEHVEKLLTVAASLHRKFLQSPRLVESFFSDYYDFYLPRMGTGLAEVKEFDSKQPVKMNERQLVANMFTPPTANQSWRKVLSLGNLLNGHEPILREIMFSVQDPKDNHYATPTPLSSDQQRAIETHRMYICSTSNDLRVALSVTTCD